MDTPLEFLDLPLKTWKRGLSVLPVGGVGLVACQDFLVREAFVSVLVGGAGSLLSGVQ